MKLANTAHGVGSRDSFGQLRPARRRCRGMALLLVMIGMIVCSILTAGFLSTQGTSLGIARNERDAYLKECAAHFARNMETVVRRDPFQWYNFYPFWKLTEPPKLSPKPKPELCPSR